MLETTTDYKALARKMPCPMCGEAKIRVSVKYGEAVCRECGNWVDPAAVMRMAKRMARLARALAALDKEVNGR
jgi:transcription initiation factor TFIIIB Brf1 subunit/transcription initiation factor TFIIB